MAETKRNWWTVVKDLWRRYYVLLLLGFGCGSSLLLFTVVREWQGYLLARQFEGAAGERVEAIRQQVGQDLATLEAVAAFFSNSDVADSGSLRRAFSGYVRPLLSRGRSIQALEWVAYVRGDERAVYEAQGAADGLKNFQITHIDKSGKVVRCPDEKEYVSVFCVEPVAGNASALGLNSLTDPVRGAAIRCSQETGHMRATAAVTLVQETGHQSGVVVYAPVYRHGLAVRDGEGDAGGLDAGGCGAACGHHRITGQGSLRGFAVAVFRVGDLVESALRELVPAGIDVHVYEQTDGAPRHMYSHWSRKRAKAPVEPPRLDEICAGLHSNIVMDIAGRRWLVVCSPSPQFLLPGVAWHPWVVLLGILLLTFVSTGLLWRAGRINHRLRREIAGRRHAESRLVLAGKLFDSSGEAIVICDVQKNIVSVNQAFTSLMGYTQEEVLGKNPRLLKSGRQDAAFYEAMWKSIAGSGVWQGEIWNRNKNGQDIPLWMAINAIKDEEGQTTHYIAVASDMTQRRAAEERIQFLAYYDALTGLPNRILLRDRLQHAMAHARRYGTKVAMMFLDLDRFKNINDSLGHSTGDLLLQEAAKRLQEVVRESDTVARMGGDEFMVVLSHCRGREDAAAVAERIQQDLSMPFAIDGRELSIEVSIGISMYPSDGQDIDFLMSSADAAMYQCKRNREGAYQFFTADISERTTRRLVVENGPAPGAGSWRAGAILPAAGQGGDGADHRGGGADPVAASEAGAGRAGRLHSNRRRERADRADRRMGIAGGVPAERSVAAERIAPGGAGGGECLGGAVPAEGVQGDGAAGAVGQRVAA